MSRFLSPELLRLAPYVPGEQPQERQYIKLNTNESPFPPSPAVTEALNGEEISKLNLYSDPEAAELIKTAAEYYGLDKSNIIAGNGSDEILAFIFKAFFRSDAGAACPDVSYGFYPVFCDLFGIKYLPVPLREDFTIRTEDYAGLKENVVIANPNAQTGIYLPLAEVEKLVSQNRDRLVVVDEAYVDFGSESAVGLIEKYDNLIVVQTMSKSRSLAGGRVGFAFASAPLIADLNAVKFSFNPYNLNRLSLIAAEKALLDTAYFKKSVKQIIENREFTSRELKKSGFRVLPSSANFILAETDKMSGEELYLALKARGILVRHLKDERIRNFVRITIGSAEQMKIFINTINEIIKEENA